MRVWKEGNEYSNIHEAALHSNALICKKDNNKIVTAYEITEDYNVLQDSQHYLRDKVARLEKDVDDITEERDSISSQKQHVEKQLNASQNELTESQQRIHYLMNRLEEAEETSQRLKQENRNLLQQVADGEIQLETLEEKHQEDVSRYRSRLRKIYAASNTMHSI
eukprot:gb/GECH01011449.1/.p1 GENE.gb/GECH01011449.1/~~gb/GECH01011449.1/.p1  ORF type:complete len:165 (+),score=54.92 gb/GECH01011449.1/:1-495(+)